MSGYQTVQNELDKGADPRFLCQTCPWDRYCFIPPTMTKSDVDKYLDDAKAKDEAAMLLKPESFPMAGLMTALVMGGKDTQATLCPVFALRMQSLDGRQIADTIKNQMQGWQKEEVTVHGSSS